VLPELLDLNVACKFCNQTFRARCDRTDATKSAPGCECKAVDSTRKATAGWAAIHQDPGAACAELTLMQQQGLHHAERLCAVEQALSTVLNKQGALGAELEKLRFAHEAVVQGVGLEIEQLRTQLKLFEEQHTSVIAEPDPRRSAASQASPSLQPGSTPNHVRHNVNGRNLSCKPPPKRASWGKPESAPHWGRASLREAIDQISQCESKADQLIAQLKATRQEKEFERQAFERVLERLLGELTRAKSELEVARGNAKLPPGPLIDLPDDSAGLADFAS